MTPKIDNNTINLIHNNDSSCNMINQTSSKHRPQLPQHKPLDTGDSLGNNSCNISTPDLSLIDAFGKPIDEALIKVHRVLKFPTRKFKLDPSLRSTISISQK